MREFIETAFAAADLKLEWKGKGLAEKGLNAKTGRTLVEVSKEFYRPAEVDLLVGDATKAKIKLGWTPKTKFKDLVALMVDAEMKRLKKKKVNL